MTKKNFQIRLGALAAALLTIFLTGACTNIKGPLSHGEACALLDKIYEGIASGFNIDAAEETYIRDRGGAPTYGEIIKPSMRGLADKLKIKKGDVFYDLGSGTGKLVCYMYMATPVEKAIGIELSESRYKRSLEALERLHAQKPTDKRGEYTVVKSDDESGLGNGAKLSEEEREFTSSSKRELTFINNDMLAHDLSDASAIFMCATCFSEKLLQKLADKFVREAKPGLRVVTLKKLPENARLKYKGTTKLPTSWSSGSPFHYYELE